MLNTKELETSAKKSFEESLRKKVKFVAKDAWPDNVERFIAKDLNNILLAGVNLGVSTATCIAEEEAVEMGKDLFSLRVLNMVEEAKEYLINVLEKHGVSREIFNEPEPEKKGK